jgi:iron complex transport system ATP-binding protein
VRLVANDVVCGYGAEPVLDGVTVSTTEGALVGLVGPNGAGKSTLLRCFHGSLRPSRGQVLLDGTDLSLWSRREIARVVGVVPQASSPAFPVSVAYFVGMGRFARERFLGGPTRLDLEVVQRSLREMGLDGLAHRPVDELSGGEFRRVLIAQALAQEPNVLLFDEPVQQLDLLHQLEVMEFARSFTRRPGASGLVVLHDLGLAARFCDRLVLMYRGRVLAEGSADEVLTPDHLRVAYGVEVVIERLAETGLISVVPLARSGPRASPPSA